MNNTRFHQVSSPNGKNRPPPGGYSTFSLGSDESEGLNSQSRPRTANQHTQSSTSFIFDDGSNVPLSARDDSKRPLRKMSTQGTSSMADILGHSSIHGDTTAVSPSKNPRTRITTARRGSIEDCFNH